MRALSLLLVALLIGACGATGESTRNGDDGTVEPDSNTGRDGSRSTAPGLSDGESDTIDAEGGDNTDYRYIDLEADSTLSVQIDFDPAEVAGTLAILDAYGEVVAEVPFYPGDDSVSIEDLDLPPGRYYVRLNVTQGSTTYTMHRDVEERVVPPTHEPDPVTEPHRDDGADRPSDRHSDRDAGTRRPRDTGADSDADGGDQPADGDTGDEAGSDSGGDAPAEPEDEGPTIRARIVNLRPRGEGTELTLDGCGSISGLSVGTSGRIGRTSAVATISEFTGPHTCVARSSAPMGIVGGESVVRFAEPR